MSEKSQVDEDYCLEMLLDSCEKSGLSVSWLDDNGGKVFGDGHAAVCEVFN